MSRALRVLLTSVGYLLLGVAQWAFLTGMLRVNPNIPTSDIVLLAGTASALVAILGVWADTPDAIPVRREE